MPRIAYLNSPFGNPEVHAPGVRNELVTGSV